jgi:hypothetical protein
MEGNCLSLSEDAPPTFTVRGGRGNPIKPYAPTTKFGVVVFKRLLISVELLCVNINFRRTPVKQERNSEAQK